MSLMKTGTPAADSCSAMTCRLFVLPVPVAPATRPWRFSMATGSAPCRGIGRALALRGAELDARPFEAVAGGDRFGESLGHGPSIRGPVGQPPGHEPEGLLKELGRGRVIEPAPTGTRRSSSVVEQRFRNSFWVVVHFSLRVPIRCIPAPGRNLGVQGEHPAKELAREGISLVFLGLDSASCDREPP